MNSHCSVWIGFDPREAAAFAVARSSIRRHLTSPLPIFGVVLDDLRKRGLYYRPTEIRPSAADRPILWDTLSGAPMSTQFAVSRFLTPILARDGFAMFADADVLARTNVMPLFTLAESDPRKAVWCVKHDYRPTSTVKMDGQRQSTYNRKLWSAVCLFNVRHPSNKALTVEYVNAAPGRDLHAFKWLADDEIGELDPAWHWVPGHSTEPNPKLIHFSEGGPWFAGYSDVPFADEWRAELARWAA